MDIAKFESRSGQSSGRSQRQQFVRFPGRLLLILIVLIAPWWPYASQSGWSQATFGLMALVALAFWWFEQATQKTKQTILPISIIPILLGVCLGLYHFIPWSGTAIKNLGNAAAYQRWDDLASHTPADLQIAERIEKEFQVKKEEVLRPAATSISIDPERTRIMTAQLILAAICYFLGAHFFHNRNAILTLCAALAINGAVIAIFGIVQKITCDTGDIFFGWKQVTGTVFGPYVNRNNAAGLLCICMAASAMVMTVAFGQDEKKTKNEDLLTQMPEQKGVFISVLRLVHELTATRIASVLLFIAILAGIFVSLSRGGVIAAILGSVVAFVMVGLSQRGEKKGAGYLGLAILIGIILVAWLGFGSQLMDRFHKAETQDLSDQGRVENWTDTLQAVPEAPFTGSGLNTYRHVHRAFRSTAEEGSNWFLYAENQYFQSLIEGGAVGLILLLTALGLAIYYTIFLIKMSFSNKGFSVAILAVFAITSQSVAAFFDFGLYIPANFLTFAVVMGAIAGAAQYHANRLKSSPWLIKTGLGKVGIVIMLILFSGGVLSLREFFRQGEIEQSLSVAETIQEKKFDATTEEIDSAIQDINRLNKKRASAKLYMATANLLTQKYQLSLYNLRTKDQELKAEEQETIWAFSSLTADSLMRMVEVNRFNPLQAKRIKEDFKNSSLVKNSLLPAYWNLLKARNLSPMVPKIHFDLADLTMALTDDSAEPHLKRAVAISPMNARYNMLSGVRHLWQSNYDPKNPLYEKGKKQLKTSLDLVPGLFRRIERSVVRVAYKDGVYPGISARQFAEEFLVEYPELMLQFVRSNPSIKNNQTVKNELLDKTLQYSEESDKFNSRNREWALARIYYEKKEWEKAIDSLDRVILLTSNNRAAMEMQADAYIQTEQFEKAEKTYKQLFSRAEKDSYKRKYTNLMKQMEMKKLQSKN